MADILRLSRAIAIMAPAAVLVAGCSVDGGPDSISPGGPAETELKDFFGGWGGGSVATIKCPNVIGWFGRAGTFLNAVGLICETAGYTWSSPMYGGSGGDSFSFICPRGFIGSGIQGSSGNYVNSMQLQCSSDTGSGYLTEKKGGSNGGCFSFQCPDDQKLVGFNLQVDKYVNGIQPICGLK